MASRGVNGASESTLNDRFIKCEGCHVNIPKDDMIKAGKCTVCQRIPSNVEQIQLVEFIDPIPRKISKKKRWTVLISRKGREYYHNTETGEECWEKPPDFDAFASEEEQFVPFKNDAVKNAVLMEQAKYEASKLGVPVQLIEAKTPRTDALEDKFEMMNARAFADITTADCDDRPHQEESIQAASLKDKKETACSVM